MPQINTPSAEDTRSFFTNYTGSINETNQTFTFSDTQNGMTFRNKGKSIVILTVDGEVYRVPPQATIEIDDNSFLSFDARTQTGSQEFEITAFREKSNVSGLGNLQSQVSNLSSQLAQRPTQAEVDSKVSQIVSGSPKGAYATLSALQTAFPTGATGVYLVTADGKWYYWNGASWTAGTVYQATGIADKTITPDKTTFFSVRNLQLIDRDNMVWTLGYIGADGLPNGTAGVYTTDFIPVDSKKTYISNSSYDSGQYDENKNFIKKFRPNSQPFVFDPQAKYVRLAFTNSGKTTSLLSEGSTLPTTNTSFNTLETLITDNGVDVLLTNKITPVVDQKLANSGSSSNLKQKKWNALGDSITTTIYSNPNYVTILRDKFSMDVVNYAVSGATIAVGAKATLSETYVNMRDDADIITVFAGVNDRSNTLGTMADRTNNTLYGACHVLFKGLMEKYPGKRLGIITPMMAQSEMANEGSGKLEQIVNAIIKVANYYCIPVFDAYRGIPINANLAIHKTTYITDGLHPNPAGHEIIARRLEKWLESL